MPAQLAPSFEERFAEVERLDEPLAARDDLQRAGASLGRLITAGLLETRRDILRITTVRAGAASRHLDVDAGAILTRRDYIEGLWSQSIGVIAMIGAAAMSFIGWLWMRKIVRIEV